jgi:hypothetical protein
LANRFFTLDCQAASHVESVICMRSAHFTGHPPYTGWKGLGKALGEDYDDRAALKEKLNEAEQIIGELAQANIYDDQLHEVLVSAETLRRARAFLENANG